MSQITVTPTPMKELIDKLAENSHSYKGIHQQAHDFLEQILDGDIKIVEANNPLTYLLEVTGANTVSFLDSVRSNIRLEYPSLALNHKDLYRYLADADYNDIFAQPGRSKVRCSILDASVIEASTEDPIKKSRTLAIPIGTYITVRGIELVFNNKITIERYSPTNYVLTEYSSEGKKVLPVNYSSDGDKTWIEFETYLSQEYVGILFDDINKSTYYKKRIPLPHDLYKIEAYTRKGQIWTPLSISLAKDVIDNEKPTLLVIDDGDYLEVRMHDIHTSMVGESIRIIVRTTEIDPTRSYVDSVPIDDIKVIYRKIETDTVLDQAETSMTEALMIVKPITPIENYRPKLTFTQLKAHVTNNSIGANIYPISRASILFKAGRLGYDLSLSKDLYTERSYVASKPNLEQHKLGFSSSLDVSMYRIPLRYEDLEKTPSIKKDLIDPNAKSWLTIPADSVFSIDRGVVSFNDATVIATTLDSLKVLDKIKELDKHDYMVNPFTYYVDYTKPSVEVQTYRTNNPSIKGSYIVERNEVESTIHSDSVEITSINSSEYKLTIQTKSTDDIKKIPLDVARTKGTVEIMLYDANGVKRYIPGVLRSKTEDGEFIYDFKIETDLKFIDGKLILNVQGEEIPVSTDQAFSVLYSYSTLPAGYTVNSSINTLLSDQTGGGLTHENIVINLYTHMPMLWALIDSKLSNPVYKTYQVDKLATYKSYIFEKDANGKLKSSDPNTCKPIIEHSPGDIVKTPSGADVYEYKKGQIMKDVKGIPILDTARGSISFLDMIVVDHTPTVSGDEDLKTYAKDMINKIERDASDNLKPLQDKLLEKTNVYFKPSITRGYINVSLPDNEEASLASVVAMKISIVVNSSVNSDTLAMISIKKSITRTISEYLRSNKILIEDEVIEKIKLTLGDSIIAVHMDEFIHGYNSVTILDSASKFVLKKRRVVSKTLGITYEDALSINVKEFST